MVFKMIKLMRISPFHYSTKKLNFLMIIRQSSTPKLHFGNLLNNINEPLLFFLFKNENWRILEETIFLLIVTEFFHFKSTLILK